MGFTERDVINRLKEASQDMHRFYKEDMLIYKGYTSDTNRLYNEIAASYLYNNIDVFKRLFVAKKESSYITDTYKKYDINQTNLNTHKQLTLKLFRQRQFGVGKILDCQTPLFDEPSKKHLGKVDLLMHTKSEELFLLKVKLENTQQSLLRYIVEGLTSARLLNHKKLLNDLNLGEHTKVKTAPLLFKDSSPYLELLEDRHWLYHLMAILDLDIFVIENKYMPYKIKRYHFNDFINPMLKRCLLEKEII